MLHVLLLRHGQTAENAQGILQGHAQTNLNDSGREQAQALATRLRTFTPRIEQLVSSDLNRAVQTAAAIEEALGLRATQTQTWRERGFGPFEGKSIGEADTWRAAMGNWDLPGAEPTEVFRSRVRCALLDVVRDYAALTCVAVVTHGAVIRTVLTLLGDGALALATDEPKPESPPIANCSILQLSVETTKMSNVLWRVAGVNDVRHLTTGMAPAFRVEG